MQIKELLINQKIKGEIKREIRKYFETNESVNETYLNLWGTAKAVLRGSL